MVVCGFMRVWRVVSSSFVAGGEEVEGLGGSCLVEEVV